MPRPRLFVSAVTSELAGARRRAAAVLNRLGYDTVSEEDFPTGFGELRRWLAEQIDGCDGVIQLIGTAYGAEPPPSADPADPWPDPALGRCSYTQFELLYAWGLATRKPKPESKRTWVILAGPDFPRERPVEQLDLPPSEAGPDVDPTAYQAERCTLQQQYLGRLTAENHLRLSAANETELENLLLRLKDELGSLRSAEHWWQRRVGWGIAAILAVVMALGAGGWWGYQSLFDTTSAAAQVTPSRIRAQLLDAVEATYARELAAAEQAADWQERERLREAAAAQRAAQAGRVDDLAETFRQIAEGSKAGSVFTELTRILQEQGVGEALAYVETQRPGILERVRARQAAAVARNRAELEPLLTSARLYATEGKPDEARALYADVLALAPAWPDALNDHRWFLVDQGDLAVIRGDLGAAGRDFRAALERATQLADIEPETDRWHQNVGLCLERLGDHAIAIGDLGGAERHHEQALAIRQRLADADPSNAGWQRDLSVSLDRLGDLKSARGDLDGALADFELSLAIAQRLADADPSNAGWQRDLVVSHIKLAESSPPEGAKTHLRTALGVLEAMETAGILAPRDAWLPEEVRRRLREAASSGE